MTACRTVTGYQIQHLNIWELHVCVYMEEKREMVMFSGEKEEKPVL